MTALLDLGPWVPILDGDDAARNSYELHYSAAKNLARRIDRGTRLFIGPGEKLVPATPDRTAHFAWRWSRFRRDGQAGIECTFFRNVGPALSSDLIRAADAIADAKWPGERHFTYVDPIATAGRRSTRSRPGECFLRADWQSCPVLSAGGLAILERLAP